MGLRFVLAAAAALLAITAFAPESGAAESRKGNRHRVLKHHSQRLYFGGYYGQIGGYLYGPLPEHGEFRNESAYNYPGHYNNQTFWERVQTQRNYPVQY